jgi:hypothetical protein
LSGCASITRGSTEEFTVESNPSGAKVAIDTGETGVTPATFIVKRKPDLVVTISKDGYETVTRKVVSKMKAKGGAALAGNVLVGGIIGIAADSITGATLNH